jgi:hypothetical protein
MSNPILHEVLRRQKILAVLKTFDWQKRFPRMTVIEAVMAALNEKFSNKICIDTQAVLWNEFRVVPVSRGNSTKWYGPIPQAAYSELSWEKKFARRVKRGDKRFEVK